MNVTLRQVADGIELPVKASPGSRRNEIRGTIGGALKVSVTAAAEKGKANTAIIKLLSKQLRLSKSQIRLLAGPTSTLKKFLIQEIELDSLHQRLDQLSQGGTGST